MHALEVELNCMFSHKIRANLTLTTIGAKCIILVMSKKTNKQILSGAWLRDTTRLALYLRDNLSCRFCKSHLSEFDSATRQLSADHLNSRNELGFADNSSANLVTVCISCNSSKKDMPWREFAGIVAERTGQRKATVLARIYRARKSPLKRKWAREVFASSDRSLTVALQNLQRNPKYARTRVKLCA